MNEYPDEQEIQQAVSVLKRLPRGLLPLDLFEVFAGKTVLPCLEVSILRLNQDQAEVLLAQRPGDDHYWPNAWHLPGGVLLSTDKLGDYSSMLERIFEKELKGEQKPLNEPEFVMNRFQETKRGRELVLEYFTEVAFADEIPKVGRFFPVSDLPEGTLEQYFEIIPAAAEAFRRR